MYGSILCVPLITIQIVVIFPSYSMRVGVTKLKGDEACWTVDMD